MDKLEKTTLGIFGAIAALVAAGTIFTGRSVNAEKAVEAFEKAQEATTPEELKEAAITAGAAGAKAPATVAVVSKDEESIFLRVGDILVVDPNVVAAMSPELRAAALASEEKIVEQAIVAVKQTQAVEDRVAALGVDPNATAATVQAQVAQVALLASEANTQMLQGNTTQALQTAQAAAAVSNVVQNNYAQAAAVVASYQTQIVSQPAVPPSQEVKNAIAKYGPSVWN